MTDGASYVELHARSAFSFLRAGSGPEALVRAAAQAGLPALALCDRNGVYGTARFHSAAKEQGFRPIVGAELAMEDGSALPVLVETPEGYRNLCRLMTNAQLRAEKGAARVTWAELPGYTAGLVALTGDEEGPVPAALERGGPAAAVDVVKTLIHAFGSERLFVEVQRHHVRGEERRVRALVALAQAQGLPLIATNGVAYAVPEHREVLDAFTCLRHKTHLDAAGLLLQPNAERHVKTPQAMAALFADLPEAVSNTARLADRLAFTLENLGYQFPEYPVPPGETQDSFLRKMTWFGAEQRYGAITPPVRAQLEHELALIARLGFSGYFLVVWDIVNFCREAAVMVQGRGSAANSAVCYSLGITAVDPIGSKLLFERFLSEGRTSWPDIDLDLPSGDRRERVIQEMYRRYGPRGVAMTANVITYRGRSAIRDLGKALNLPPEHLDRFSRLYASGDFPHTLGLEEQLHAAGLPTSHPRVPALMRLYAAAYGLPRHLGQHSGGMILCRGNLDTVVPLENASMPGRVVAQWDKDDCEDLGLVKVDLLGLGMMAVMQDALELTRVRGRPVDLAHIPKDDAATFSMMCEADTIGVFQIESRAQMATLPRMQPRSFYDVVVEVAIIRPGPIQGNLVHPYLERRAGRAPIDYILPEIRPILERTLGVPLFQEQVLKIAMVVAGFSGAEAEELRRALGFKRNNDRMDRVLRKLRASMAARGVPGEAAAKIEASIQSFALYGFPESHAISFALIAYGSAWMKVHRTAEFYAGLLNNQPMGFYSRATLVQDARRHGLRILPPCIALSDWPCTVVDDHTVRLGLLSLRGLRRETCASMLAARETRPFRSVSDFLRRTAFSPEDLRTLAATGTLNALAGDRRRALWAVTTPTRGFDLFHAAEDVADMASTEAREAPPDDADLAAGLRAAAEAAAGANRKTSQCACPLPDMTPEERLRADYAGLGLTVGAHPMAHLRAQFPGILTASALKAASHGAYGVIAGAVICRQRPGTAKGFVFVSLEDETGIANAIVSPQLFERQRLVITQETFLRISGRIQNIDGVPCLKANTVEPLFADPLPAATSHDFH